MLDGAVRDVAGHEVVFSYAGVRAEYDALRESAIVLDRSHRGRMRFIGDKAAEALTGLVTNDVLALRPGHGQYAVALTAKGRIVADLRIYAAAGSYLVDSPARAFGGWAAMVRKYVNPRIAGYRDESHAVRNIGVFGPRARHVVANAMARLGVGDPLREESLSLLVPYANLAAATGGNTFMVARANDLEVEGWDFFVPFEAFDPVWEAIVAAGARPAGLGAWEIARIEAGRPEWGLDMDETTIPQEANLEELGAISYTKGCYIGQEVVARVHFRGHVNRHLRGLRTAGSEALPPAAQLFDDAGAHVGEVRSAAVSPRLGGIALGMVRREVAVDGSLQARWEDGERRVDVTRLPFPA